MSLRLRVSRERYWALGQLSPLTKPHGATPGPTSTRASGWRGDWWEDEEGPRLQRPTKSYSSQLRDFTLGQPSCTAINSPAKLQTDTQRPTSPGALGWQGGRWGTSLSDPGPTNLRVARGPDQMETITPPGHHIGGEAAQFPPVDMTGGRVAPTHL